MSNAITNHISVFPGLISKLKSYQNPQISKGYLTAKTYVTFILYFHSIKL